MIPSVGIISIIQMTSIADPEWSLDRISVHSSGRNDSRGKTPLRQRHVELRLAFMSRSLTLSFGPERSVTPSTTIAIAIATTTTTANDNVNSKCYIETGHIYPSSLSFWSNNLRQIKSSRFNSSQVKSSPRLQSKSLPSLCLALPSILPCFLPSGQRSREGKRERDSDRQTQSDPT